MKKEKPSNILADQAAAKKANRRGWILFIIFGPLFLISFPEIFAAGPLDATNLGMTIFCGVLPSSSPIEPCDFAR